MRNLIYRLDWFLRTTERKQTTQKRSILNAKNITSETAEDIVGNQEERIMDILRSKLLVGKLKGDLYVR